MKDKSQLRESLEILCGILIGGTAAIILTAAFIHAIARLVLWLDGVMPH